eukprot:TRINITY_DN2950_c0_g1_i2.p1 TRINITY_DN2950_c0_g1~~TRINITY_DN2950_c0_g1_i2.p1  ORF type:complete len:109 (-),score=19.94 TRINITY_DN2950_c0_g1_i2:166-492(-)
MQHNHGLLMCHQIRTFRVFLLAFALTGFMASVGETKAVTVDTAIACRPDILQLVPPRIRQICESLEQLNNPSPPSYYSAINSVKRDSDSNGEGPEHLFLRFGRSGSAL